MHPINVHTDFDRLDVITKKWNGLCYQTLGYEMKKLSSQQSKRLFSKFKRNATNFVG